MTDRERWERALAAMPVADETDRRRLREALYLQSLTHAGHRTDAILEALTTVS